MKTLLIAATIFVSAMITCTSTFAHSRNINAREARIEHRIQRGIASGRLTQPEATKLNSRVNHLHQREAFFRRDGRLVGRERIALQHQANRISRSVWRQKQDSNWRCR